MGQGGNNNIIGWGKVLKMFSYLDGIVLTQKDLRALAKKLGANEQPMGAKEWFEYRDKHSTIPLAYAKNNYGVVAELYFDKVEGRAILV